MDREKQFRMTLRDMKKFLLVFGVGLRLVSGSAYGDYPPPKEILRCLLGKYWDADKHF